MRIWQNLLRLDQWGHVWRLVLIVVINAAADEAWCATFLPEKGEVELIFILRSYHGSICICCCWCNSFQTLTILSFLLLLLLFIRNHQWCNLLRLLFLFCTEVSSNLGGSLIQNLLSFAHENKLCAWAWNATSMTRLLLHLMLHLMLLFLLQLVAAINYIVCLFAKEGSSLVYK